MFGYRSNVPKVRLTTDRLVVRLVHDRDAWRLADYYAENRHFLKPWEPVRDESHCYPSGWQARLGMINEFHKQGSAFYFGLFDPGRKRDYWRCQFFQCCSWLFSCLLSRLFDWAKNGRAKDSCLKP
ncbi:ribosomal-protein-alanine acetyltransferase [Escherichia coli]|nr:ribosomal-protein-alanine acetyltransferase [Escherichia coli]